ncbi:MAG: S41 family peptidase [Bacteroidota bacterium]
MNRVLILMTFYISLQIAPPAYAQKILSPKQSIPNFDYAVEQLHINHQGFYQYQSKELVDQEIAELRKAIRAPMAKLDYYLIIRKLVALMNEGHGSVDLSNWTKAKVGIPKSFLPLAVQYLNGDLIITQNFGKDIQGLSKGLKLIAVNDRPVEEIIDAITPFIASDGFNETSKLEWIGNINFSLLYRLVYGKEKRFTLTVSSYDNPTPQTIEIPAIRFTRFKSKHAKFERWKNDASKFLFKAMNDSIGYLSIPGFGMGDIDYETFYREQFKKIKALNIKHLIIDIQENSGGEEGNENLLFSYLSEERIRKYRKVTMLPIPYQQKKDSKSFKLDQWALKGDMAERGDFTLYSDYYSELGYSKPQADHIYKNKVYVLTSGLTFSGGAEFASMLKMTNRATFIGEETGGAYEGNVSSYNETIHLLGKKISIDIPMVHFQMNVAPNLRGRGVMPDHQVPQTWTDYLKRRNAKLAFAIDLITN